ncbi:MAG TPA: hypothetical protein VMD91_07230 [Candidatus Sulfotelmatobacter sp.]|nr:hypothetical protein [Candidatus Sulfotelmatobacter sp.]
MTTRRIFTLLAILALCALALPTLAQGGLVRFTGQLLDVRDGYVYFSTGDAFKLAPDVKLLDYVTGKPTTLQPHVKLYARAVLDPATKQVTELDLTPKKVPFQTVFAPDVTAAAANTATVVAPELIGGKRITGKQVPVEFLVTVPPTTAITDVVYLATDVSNWNPQAVRLDRVDGERYRTVLHLASGTKFTFRVTRGSWNSVAVGPDGLEEDPITFFVPETDAYSRKVTVAAWSDDRTGAPQEAQPGAVPTPFNPNPFNNGSGLFPRSRATPPGGLPPTRPGPQNPP